MCMRCGREYQEENKPIFKKGIGATPDEAIARNVYGCCMSESLSEIYDSEAGPFPDNVKDIRRALILKARASGRPMTTAERIMILSTAKGAILDKETAQEYIPGLRHIGDRPLGMPGIKPEQFKLFFPEKWQPEKIDFIIGMDPALDEPSRSAMIILKNRKKNRLKIGDTLHGPQGQTWRIKDISKWDWLHRLLTISKYYNSKIYLTPEK